MKVFPRTCIIFIISIIGLFACQSETSGEKLNSKVKVQNLETFARLYGYARWFHPSDEAQEIDWDKFAVLGVQKVENIKSPVALRDTLYKLFSPIVQGLQIYDAHKPEIFDPKALLSPDPNAKPVAWQHSGVYLSEQSSVYKSTRTNKYSIDKTKRSTVAVKYLMDSSHLNGKDVKFSGHFKNKNGNAKLFIIYITSSGNNKKHEVHIESHKWQKYELTLTIPKDTKRIAYGFEIDGYADILADDFDFVVNNKGYWIPVDTTNMGFECGKTEDEITSAKNWNTHTTYHKFEVTDEDHLSGKYSLKVCHTGKMFDRMPQFGEITKSPIGNNLICVVPLTLQTNGSATYPQTETSSLNQLKSELSNISPTKDFNQQANLASVIITWNVLQHFFPYFDVIDTNWNEVLGETLNSTLSNKHKEDFYITLSRMIAQIDDGHGIIYDTEMFLMPLIRTEYIENKIVITASKDTTLKRGDIILEINGKPAMEVLEEKERIISGSPQLRRFRALNILTGKLEPNKSTNEFERKGTQLLIERDCNKQCVIVTKFGYGSMSYNMIDERKYLYKTIIEIEPDIYYINMSKCTENEFEQKKEVLANAKAVIYDRRGSFNLHFNQIIPYLTDKPVISTWWNTPQTIYPNRKAVEFDKNNWAIEPKQPLFKSKSIIINTPSVVSSSETITDIIDHYNLATTIGETTAGCNGNANRIINLPCGYNVMWTGMKVLKHDGSQLYLKGFEPDYPVKRTIQAIKEGRDEYLEKALEIARQENW